MKRKPEVLEHGWTRQRFIPDGITAKQAQEQIAYDNAVKAAVKVMERLSR